MGETLYSLTYGSEAVIPMEISLSSMRISKFSPTANDELMMKQSGRVPRDGRNSTNKLPIEASSKV